VPDTLTPEQRSRVMSRVRGRDTKPELELRRAMWAAGLRGWRCHRRDVPGQPDVAFGRSRVAVFVDGAWWHGHPLYYTPGKSGAFWDAKIRRNVERDREVDRALAALGWCVVRLWDFEVIRDPDAAARRVAAALETARATTGRLT
jgi:DNA mismatch endonuclease (patch repair protein)